MNTDLSKLPLKISYDTGIDDLVEDFYVPVLSVANQYDRIAGFFSSTVLATAAKGIEMFLYNNGRMRLVTCPRLSPEDARMIEQSVEGFDEVISKQFLNEYSSMTDAFQAAHVKALGWMLANGRLEIKIAVVRKNGRLCPEDEVRALMHQKVGIVYDRAGHILSFSGSNNESAGGWMENIEEFKVFMNWAGTADYVASDIDRFRSFWEPGQRRDCEVRDIPQAVKEHLIKESRDFEPSQIHPRKKTALPGIVQKQELKPFYYQLAAMKMWNENSRRLLLEMCTGSGKTRTAIACMMDAAKNTDRLLYVVATPQPDLTAQWKTDIDGMQNPFDADFETGSPNWVAQLQSQLIRLKTGMYRNLIIYTTHDIIRTEKFLGLLDGLGNRVTKFLIADEVHGLGSPANRQALTDTYSFRLGLSATPSRWFDEYGTSCINRYFGEKAFTFTISEAQTNINPATGKTFLVNYHYHPKFVSLTDEELAEYKKLTLKLARMNASDNAEESAKAMEFIRFKRANIEKRAENKYRELEHILNELGNDLTDTIIFVSFEQIEQVMRMLGRRGIKATPFTKDTGTVPSSRFDGMSERDYIKKLFRKQRYQVLVAIKCLDEGIDIPSAKTAVIMASSTNPREYIQRIGRVIRQAPGKTEANIYDLIIRPDLNAFRDSPSLLDLEKRVFKKEIERIRDISTDSLDNVTTYRTIAEILEETDNG